MATIIYANVPNMTTIVDIANKLKISKSTVSRALTNSSDVSAKTRERVLRTAKEMNYSVNAYARNLVTNRSHLISFMIPDIADAFYQKIAQSADEYLSNAGYSMFYRNVKRDPKESLKFLKQAMEFHMDGVFITLDDWTDEICDFIANMNIPVISLRRKTPDRLKEIVPYVDCDYYEGLDNTITYLSSYGHKEIGYIAFETIVGKERISAYEKICSKYGLAMHMIRNRSFQDAGVRIEVGYNSAKKLINENPEITAILSGDDQLAIGALKYCNEAGIRVPEDISIMGCDDRSIGSLYCIQLTTLGQQREEAGLLAGQLMIDMIEHPGFHESINVPMIIRERRTVGRAAR